MGAQGAGGHTAPRGAAGCSSGSPKATGAATGSRNPSPACSADERFDATFHTNVLVNSSGHCQYLPPGKGRPLRPRQSGVGPSGGLGVPGTLWAPCPVQARPARSVLWACTPGEGDKASPVFCGGAAQAVFADVSPVFPPSACGQSTAGASRPAGPLVPAAACRCPHPSASGRGPDGDLAGLAAGLASRAGRWSHSLFHARAAGPRGTHQWAPGRAPVTAS